jgi:VWFA-related protein
VTKKTLRVLATWLVILPIFAHAQDPVAPTFRTGTTLIEFTLVALDSSGNPVTDLSKEELVLTEDGRTRDIAFFRFDGDNAPMPDARLPTLPPGFVTNRSEHKNVTAIALDLLNINVGDPREKHDQTTVRGLILRYLTSLPPNTQVGLFRFSEIHPMTTLQPFTDRVDLIRSRISSLDLATRREFSDPTTRKSRLGNGEMAAAAAEAEARALATVNQQLRETRLAKTLGALEALANHLAGMPGRKSLIWISDGVPIRASANGSFDNYEAQIRQTTQRIANQGIAVYPVMAAGLSPIRRDDNLEVAAFNVVADVTGGRVVRDDNDLTLGVRLAANDQRGAYTVSFYAADAPDDRWRNLHVSVKREGVAVRHRDGYLAVRRAQPQSWPAKAWTALANQALDSTAIRLNGRTEGAANEATVVLQIETSDLYFHEKDGQVIADLEIALVEKTSKGITRIGVRPMEIGLTNPLKSAPTAMIPLSTTWTLKPGTTAVRALVRDRFTGRYGSLEMPLDLR